MVLQGSGMETASLRSLTFPVKMVLIEVYGMSYEELKIWPCRSVMEGLEIWKVY